VAKLSSIHHDVRAREPKRNRLRPQGGGVRAELCEKMLSGANEKEGPAAEGNPVEDELGIKSEREVTGLHSERGEGWKKFAGKLTG